MTETDATKRTSATLIMPSDVEAMIAKRKAEGPMGLYEARVMEALFPIVKEGSTAEDTSESLGGIFAGIAATIASIQQAYPSGEHPRLLDAFMSYFTKATEHSTVLRIRRERAWAQQEAQALAEAQGSTKQ